MNSSSSSPIPLLLLVRRVSILFVAATITNGSHGFLFVSPPPKSSSSPVLSIAKEVVPGDGRNIPFSRSQQQQLQIRRRLSTATTTLCQTQQQQTEDKNYPNDNDYDDALQTLFLTYSDSDNNNSRLMSKKQLMSIPSIKDMLLQGDLLSSELDEIWDAVPKKKSLLLIKKVMGKEEEEEYGIDVDSFIQVYRDIDDMFENEEEEEEMIAATAAVMSENVLVADTITNAAADDDDGIDDDDHDELTQIFDSLKDGGTTITFSQLRQWEEITSLVDERMLGEDEFKSLWEMSVGKDVDDGGGGGNNNMDLERFFSFNAALDNLFVFDEEEEEEENDEVYNVEEEEEERDFVEQVQQQAPMITETDLPPAVLFSQLANENYLVGRTELQRWGELQGMISDGDLSLEELNVLLERVEKAPGNTDIYLDEEGFCSLVEAIYDLFEDVVDDENNDEQNMMQQQQREKQQTDIKELKEELLELLEDIDKIGQEEGRQLCGLDCSELEQARVLEVVGELEREPYNRVVKMSASGGGAVDKEELAGNWELLYSSSSTMKYNEGLSGLAGGLTRFGGLQQKLFSSKYLSDVEYTEQVIGKLGGKSFEVKISGDWDLKTEVSLFTGKPANVLSVTPDKVSYGPRSDKADHWKSLGPMNMLLLTYLDEDLRIMRGNTSTDTLFIFKRC